MKRIHILILTFFIATHISAQVVVHIDNDRLAALDSGFFGSINYNINFIQNINNIFQNNAKGMLQYINGKASVINQAQYNLTVFNGNNIVDDLYNHLRLSYKLNSYLTLEVYNQWQYNKIIRIERRILNGVGPRFRLVKSKNDSLHLFVGITYMNEYEREYSAIINRHHRISNFISFGFPVGKNALIDFMGYFQPDIVKLKDFRSMAETMIKLKMTSKLSFRFSISVFYDAFPPEEMRNTFYNFSNGLMYNF